MRRQSPIWGHGLAHEFWYNCAVMKQTVMLFALLASAAVFAKGTGNDKSGSWPMEEYVLANVLDTQLDCGGWGKNVDIQ